MDEITSHDYWEEVQSLAKDLVSEALAYNENDLEAAREDIFDARLYETIDGHQWVIHTYYNMQVLTHSPNDCAIEDMGLDGALDDGMAMFHARAAYCALYADVSEALNTVLDEHEASQGQVLPAMKATLERIKG